MCKRILFTPLAVLLVFVAVDWCFTSFSAQFEQVEHIYLHIVTDLPSTMGFSDGLCKYVIEEPSELGTDICRIRMAGAEAPRKCSIMSEHVMGRDIQT